MEDWSVVDVFPGEKRGISKSAYRRKVLSSSKPRHDEDGVDFPREHTPWKVYA